MSLNEPQYVITNEDDDEPLFWSNADGWGFLSTATIFTRDEANELNLPIGGKWISLVTALATAPDEED